MNHRRSLDDGQRVDERSKYRAAMMPRVTVVLAVMVVRAVTVLGHMAVPGALMRAMS
jgi:hypothetical protein